MSAIIVQLLKSFHCNKKFQTKKFFPMCRSKLINSVWKKILKIPSYFSVVNSAKYLLYYLLFKAVIGYKETTCYIYHSIANEQKYRFQMNHITESLSFCLNTINSSSLSTTPFPKCVLTVWGHVADADVRLWDTMSWRTRSPLLVIDDEFGFRASSINWHYTYPEPENLSGWWHGQIDVSRSICQLTYCSTYVCVCVCG